MQAMVWKFNAPIISMYRVSAVEECPLSRVSLYVYIYMCRTVIIN